MRSHPCSGCKTCLYKSLYEGLLREKRNDSERVACAPSWATNNAVDALPPVSQRYALRWYFLPNDDGTRHLVYRYSDVHQMLHFMNLGSLAHAESDWLFDRGVLLKQVVEDSCFLWDQTVLEEDQQALSVPPAFPTIVKVRELLQSSKLHDTIFCTVSCQSTVGMQKKTCCSQQRYYIYLFEKKEWLRTSRRS